MNDFTHKLEVFFKYFIDYENYKIVLTGLRNTLVIAVCGLIIGIVIGSIVAAFKVAGSRSKVAKVISYIGDAYTGLFRGTPIVVQLIIFHFIIFRGSGINTLLEAVLVFGLNSGAYVAEIMRGGILSVDIGQTEAGRTLGLSYTTTMFRVVIPQAIKNVVPTLGNRRHSAGDQKRGAHAGQRADRPHQGHLRCGLRRHDGSQRRFHGDRRRHL